MDHAKVLEIGSGDGPSLESVWTPQEEHPANNQTGELVLTIGEEERHLSKPRIYCGTMGDLAKLGKTLEVINLYQPGMVVRRIEIQDDGSVIVDPMNGEEPLVFVMGSKVFYEPWFMDRGSYMVYHRGMAMWVKFATEYDPVRVVG